MRNATKAVLAGFLITALFACKKTDPHEAIIGSWEVSKTYLSGNEMSGPGEMTFQDCGTPPCPGTSTEKTNNTTGDISWELNEDASKLTITDTSSGGGAWNATYDVDVLTSSSLTIRTNSILGELKVEFNKK